MKYIYILGRIIYFLKLRQVNSLIPTTSII